MNLSYGFAVENMSLATRDVSVVAGGEQTGWRDGVGTDALFLGGIDRQAIDSQVIDRNVYCDIGCGARPQGAV